MRFLDNTGPFLLPTGWHQVTTKQYCDLQAQLPDHGNLLDILPAAASVLAGRRVEWHPSMIDALEFLAAEPPSEGGLPYPQNLGQESYLQVEHILQLLAEQPFHEALPILYAAFVVRLRYWHVPSLADMSRVAGIAAACQAYPITEVYPAVKHCLSEVQRLQQKYQRLYHDCHCEQCTQAQEAGASRFAAYKHFNQLKRVAQDYHTTPDAVAQWPWETFALHLLHERDMHEYQVDLHALKKSQS